MSDESLRSSINSAASPRKWSEFFDNNFTINVSHRGNFDCFSKEGGQNHLMVFLHCAAHNALSFAALCKEISCLAKCKQLCISLRGHGKTFTEDDSNYNLETMTIDISMVLERLYSNGLPDMILIGHGLGGCIATNLCLSLKCVIALVIMDALEDITIKFIPSLIQMYRDMPSSFDQLEDAILWAVQNDFIGNIYSASASVPGDLWKPASKVFACDEVNLKGKTCSNISMIEKFLVDVVIKDKLDVHVDNSHFQGSYVYRLDLSSMEKYCSLWYRGLTKKFLQISIPKLMILSEGELLNEELIKSQMLGKFQCDILPSKGRILHEDKPEVAAEIIVKFLKNKINNFETFK